ncbi:MAG: response regulator transcription factor [Bryobacterales bacterium]|nr:response regulator transcription factor [Bryobacterales bacterium]
MRLVIVEDEPLAREKLAASLRAAAPEAVIVAQLASVAEAVRWFSSHLPPDLLFCDIQLTDGLSFEIFRATPIRCPVVFTTAFDDYSLEAFQTNSIDYLLKPIRQSQVASALAKYRALAAHFTADYARRLHAVTHEPSVPRDRFLVRKGTGHLVVKINDVAYFYTEDKLVFLVTHAPQRHLIDKTLAEIEAVLPPPSFFRANRATLVHIDSIVRCSPYGKGKLLLELRPPSAEPVIVSQERAAACRQWLGA